MGATTPAPDVLRPNGSAPSSLEGCDEQGYFHQESLDSLQLATEMTG